MFPYLLRFIYPGVRYRTELVRVKVRVKVPYHTGRREHTPENVASLVAISFLYNKVASLYIYSLYIYIPF